ncbi:hypothetical protein NL676_001001 [Syzygium grande]|nr:hypothetical protein NL676_001001 [Syzygium grande]
MARKVFPLVNATNGHGSQLELTWLLCAVAFSMVFIFINVFACGKSEQKPREKKGRGGGGGSGGGNLARAGGLFCFSNTRFENRNMDFSLIGY